VTRGIIRAIDYQITATGMSSIIILAKKEVMKDLMRVITIARTEYRRLDQPEANVLIAMYNGVKTEDIPKALSMQTDDANKCIRRLMRIGYSDPKGHLTSYGINAVIELMRTAKWQGGSQ
jgi:helix-turn-helix protein